MAGGVQQRRQGEPVRLMCARCAAVKVDDSAGGKQARKVAASCSPPARLTVSWRCPACGVLNRRAEPRQAALFGAA